MLAVDQLRSVVKVKSGTGPLRQYSHIMGFSKISLSPAEGTG